MIRIKYNIVLPDGSEAVLTAKQVAEFHDEISTFIVDNYDAIYHSDDDEDEDKF